jgi:hypothetical protein
MNFINKDYISYVIYQCVPLKWQNVCGLLQQNKYKLPLYVCIHHGKTRLMVIKYFFPNFSQLITVTMTMNLFPVYTYIYVQFIILFTVNNINCTYMYMYV